ncbi:DUF2637 domain-containing protein [Gordonia sp. NPDC058843]|uniref:DUF2637 domain-containing protein n=1 Tax=Gordonia sp. NPDC058843 TaxID=3346648 RepID=UPI00368E0BBE
MATAVILSLIVVSASFTLSFSALADLARMSGAIPGGLTWLLPVVIDVFILQATWCVYVATRRHDDTGKRYHFAMLAIFSTISVAGNAGHAFLATDRGVTHGLMAVAIAIVAPLALLASIHGLVMHVWTGAHNAPASTSGTGRDRRHEAEGSNLAQHALPDSSERALHAQPQANAVDALPEGHFRHEHTHLDEVTNDDLQLARLVCSRGRVRGDERTVARALVRERRGAPREETARIAGVHRTTIGRWVYLAEECRSMHTGDERVHTDGEDAHTRADHPLVDA